MDNRNLLEKLSKSFSRDGLVQFLRAASGKFKPEQADYKHYLDGGNLVRNLQKLGKIDFDDSRRLIVLAGELDGELTSQSGKQRQYDVAKKVLKGENLDAGIFVFHDDAGHFRFSLITAQFTKEAKREFSSFRRYTYFVTPDANQNRTFIEYIGKADFSSVERITEAFSVEPVTKEFFREYRRIFEEAESTIKLKWTDEKKRLYTQRFFNRVMFLAFLERKGWLIFNGRKDYMKALFADYHAGEKEKNANFHRSRLNVLFFWGLNNPRGDERSSPEFRELSRRIGDVPYLNGGLFDQEVDDEEHFFPDAVVAKILGELIYQFNFTVTESTPLDIEVAVDPEMLGRIFEELVTGRHESGSYYTPKPVVAFMCREALKGYLKTSLPAESDKALAAFVDKNDAADLKNPLGALDALRVVKVCDPACGSGAYLLGMLHELLEQVTVLFAQYQKDAPTTYRNKLDIIQNNLYGVDLDPFAVSIARLRLWLSLIVDYEGDNPPPLPNLDFKIESGDSLTAPDPSGGLQPDMFRQQQVKDFLSLKNEFMGLHAGSDNKKKLDKKIRELRTKIEEWAHPKGYDKTSNAFDWQVDFAEVFAPELAEGTLKGKMAGLVNATKGQMELTDAPKEGGFDIILANPPYGVQVKVPYLKPQVAPDSYAVFMVRAIQTLRDKGVAQFIVPTSWETGEGYEAFRKLLLSQVNIEAIVNLPYDVFETPYVDTCIVGYKKSKSKKYSYRVATLPKDLNWKDSSTQFTQYLQTIPIEVVNQDKHCRILLQPLLGEILSRLENSKFIHIEDITDSRRGIEAYQYQILTSKKTPNLLPFFTGNIYRYQIEQAPFSYVKISEIDSPYHSGERLGIRRVVSRKNRIMCSLLQDDFVVKKDIYLFKINAEKAKNFSYLYLLGFLNSSLCSYLYLARYSAATKDDFRQITLSGVRELLVYKPTDQEKKVIETIAKKLQSLYKKPDTNEKEITILENELDEIFFDFYGIKN